MISHTLVARAIDCSTLTIDTATHAKAAAHRIRRQKKFGTVIAALLVAAIASAASAQTPVSDVYTLYRDSVLDTHMRIHIATFDAAESVEYNRGNCMLARDLFLAQEGVATNFWCEPGRYRPQ